MSDGTFYGYILLLVVSGLTLSVLAAHGFGQSTGARVLDGLFSVGFLGYAFYLFFVFESGQVTIWFYAFIVPIVATVKAFKGWRAGKHSASFPPAGPWSAQHTNMNQNPVQPSLAQPGFVQHGSAQHGSAQHGSAQHGSAQHGFGPPGIGQPNPGHFGSAQHMQPAPIASPAPYTAPALTGQIDQPPAASPYGRYTPGEPIGFPPAASQPEFPHTPKP